MPTYEYKCKSCGFIFEKFQQISDEPIKKCPKCGCEVARVIYGGSGVIFKGSGWYVTDYGKGRSSASIGAKDADLENVERVGDYNGMYFVLGGLLPILEKEPEKRIRIKKLLELIKKRNGNLKEIILALSLNPEGENT